MRCSRRSCRRARCCSWCGSTSPVFCYAIAVCVPQLTHATPTQASALPRVRAFTYLSTAFVNTGAQPGSVVEERIYPLAMPEPGQAAGAPINGLALAERLLGMSDEDAQAEARPWSYRALFVSGTQHAHAELMGLF